MANELLKFKKGLYANLPTAMSAGTVYVTTDEQAMYVDISDSKRIRLGETVHFNTLADFQEFLKGTKPPYNPQAFYYIDSENALLKWVSSGGTYDPDVDGDGKGDSNGKWKQINSTSAITADLTALANRVTKIETDQVTQNTNIAANASAITRIDGEIGETDGSTAGSLWKAIKDNEAAIESNDADILSLNNNKLNVNDFNAYKTTTTSAIQAVNDKIGTDATAGTALGRIKALEDSNALKASQADLEKLNTTVYGSANGTLADSGLVKKVDALETNKANVSDFNALRDRVNGHDTDIAGLTTNLGPSNAQAGTGSAFARIKKLEDSVGGGSGLSSRLDEVEKVLNGDGTNPGLVDDVENIQQTIGTKGDAANKGTIYGDITALTNKNNTQDTAISQLEQALNNTDDGILKRLTAVETLADATDKEIGTKDSSITQTTVWAAIKANKDAAATNATKIGDANSGLTKKVNDNASKISTNSTAITNINNTIGTKDASITETTLWSAIKNNRDDIGELEQTIANEINAANGMTYKGGVSQYTALPSSNIKVGDTYVATQGFSYRDGDKTVQVYAGDLLVASGTETGGIITSNLKWTLVNTGYIQSHESKLGVTASAANTPAAINLTSHVAGAGVYGDLGKVTFTSDNLTVSSTYDQAINSGNININIVWEDFN